MQSNKILSQYYSAIHFFAVVNIHYTHYITKAFRVEIKHSECTVDKVNIYITYCTYRYFQYITREFTKFIIFITDEFGYF